MYCFPCVLVISKGLAKAPNSILVITATSNTILSAGSEGLSGTAVAQQPGLAEEPSFVQGLMQS